VLGRRTSRAEAEGKRDCMNRGGEVCPDAGIERSLLTSKAKTISEERDSVWDEKKKKKKKKKSCTWRERWS